MHLLYEFRSYVRTVIATIDDENVCDLDDSWSKTSDETPIYVNGLELWCFEDGWRIYEEETSLKNNTIKKFGLQKFQDEDDLSYFLLKDTSEKDRVEIAIDFIDVIQS